LKSQVDRQYHATPAQIEPPEEEGDYRGRTENREGKARPSGEKSAGKIAGRSTTAAAAANAGALAGDGEDDGLRISSL
jgi:hypothetical protein